MTILVSIRYPISERSHRTLARALELAEETDDKNLIILHVNLFQRGHSVSQRDLQNAVRREFGPIQATYVTRGGFILEEAILDEAVNQKADHLIIGRNRRSKWRTFIRRALNIGVDLEPVLRKKSDIRLEAVD